MYRSEMDPSTDESKIAELLGIAQDASFEWVDYMDIVGDGAGGAWISASDVDAIGQNDCSLLGHGLETCTKGNAVLITNDEDLITRVQVKRREMRRNGVILVGTLLALPSLAAVQQLATCGAIPLDITNDVLASEYDDISSRLEEGWKRTRKLDRVRKVATELHLPEPGKIDDADIWEHFLSKDEEDG